MKLAIMQPYFFPYIGYFQLLNAVDKFVAFDDVNYIKKGWINRNRILLNGAAHPFTIPVLKASQNISIANTMMDPSLKWREKLIVTMEHAYKQAPYFSEVFPIIEGAILKECPSIASYALNSIEVVKNYLGMDTEIQSTSSIYGNENLKGPNRILDICLKEAATTYINPNGGIGLYDAQQFKNAGVDLQFIFPSEIIYSQQQVSFIENLSIIDVLMFNSKAECNQILNQYKLQSHGN
jgi:hypothetical protein